MKKLIHLYTILVLCLLCINTATSQTISFELQKAHTSKISKLIFSANNDLIFSKDVSENSISLWQTATGKKLKKMRTIEGYEIIDFIFDKTNNTIIVLQNNGIIKVWDYIKNEIISEKKVTSSELAALSAESNRICVLNNDTNSIINSFNPLYKNNSTQCTWINKNLTLHDTTFYPGFKTVMLSYFSTSGKMVNRKIYNQSMFKDYTQLLLLDRKIICGTNKGDILITNFKGKKIAKYKFGKVSISALSVSNDKELLTIGNESGQIITIKIATGEVISNCSGVGDYTERMYYTKDGKTLFMVKSNEILTYNYETNNSKKLNLKTKIHSLSIDSIVGDNLVYIKYLFGNAETTNGSSKFEGVWNIFKNTFESHEVEASGTSNFQKYLNSIKQKIDGFHDITVSSSYNSFQINKGNGEIINVLTDHSGPITAIIINKKYAYITTVSGDGIKNWDLQTGKFLFASTFIGVNNYIHTLNNGYYFGTKRIFNSINCVQGVNIIPNYKMDLEYNRPDLVTKQIPQHDSLLLAAIEHSYMKRKKNDINPLIQTNSAIEINVREKVKQGSALTLKLTIKATNALVNKIYLFVNGVDENIVLEQGKAEIDIQHNIELGNGKNEIEIFTQNTLGEYSNKINIQENNTIKVKSNLYLICIGSAKFSDVSKNLNYADKDAKDVFNLFLKSKQYETIKPFIYINKDVKQSILGDIEALLNKAGKNDMVVLFFAGHGILNKNLDYYLSTYDVNFIEPENEGIAYEKLESILKNCKSRQKLFMIDACHSGDVEKSEMKESTQINSDTNNDVVFRSANTNTKLSQNELSLLLSKELFATGGNSTGTSIIGASMGSQYALESNNWNNGVFTYALLEGLNKKKADYNNDNKIMLVELQFYINKLVLELTNGKQKPTTRSENLIGNMRVR